MADNNVMRKLAAILCADVVGYSRLMAKDEAGETKQAQDIVADLKQHHTEELGASMMEVFPYKREEDMTDLANALQRAGL